MAATRESEQIDRINSEVSAQADLIAQISAALDGKGVGGGGSVETCDVTVSVGFGAVKKIYYVNADGEVVEQHGGVTYDTFTGAVRKGSAVCVAAAGNLSSYTYSCSNSSNSIHRYSDTAYLVVNESDTFDLTKT